MPETDMEPAAAESELAGDAVTTAGSQPGRSDDTRTGRSRAAEQMANEDIVSPTLRILDASRRPQQKTVCERPELGMVRIAGKEVKCYCRVMFLTSWSTKTAERADQLRRDMAGAGGITTPAEVKKPLIVLKNISMNVSKNALKGFDIPKHRGIILLIKVCFLSMRK